VGDTSFTELDKVPLLDENDEVPEPTPPTGKQSSLTTVYALAVRTGAAHCQQLMLAVPYSAMRNGIYSFSLWNAMIGSSLLAMPYAINEAGWALGTFVLLSMCAVSLYCALLILQHDQGNGAPRWDRLGQSGVALTPISLFRMLGWIQRNPRQNYRVCDAGADLFGAGRVVAFRLCVGRHAVGRDAGLLHSHVGFSVQRWRHCRLLDQRRR